MITSNDIAALILCAGRSSRMGYFKPLLPLGRDNFIERIISLYRGVGIENILVVCGHEAQRVIPELTRLGVTWVINERYDKGMFSSIQTGVSNLHGHGLAFFLHPADIPFVQPDTLQSLIVAFSAGRNDICRPAYLGKHGHPPLISLALSGPILEFTDEGGMRTLLARYAEKSRDVHCNDPGILLDIDTPEDYEKALKNISPISVFNS